MYQATYNALFDEIEKIAQEGDKEKKKSNFKRNLAIAGAGVAGAALLGAGIYAMRKGKGTSPRKTYQKASKQYWDSGGPGAGGADKKKWDSYAKAGDDHFGKSNPRWSKTKQKVQQTHKDSKEWAKRPKPDYSKVDDTIDKLSRHGTASAKYNKVGGPLARGQKKVWNEYVKTGDDLFGKEDKKWALRKSRYHKMHEDFKKL